MQPQRERERLGDGTGLLRYDDEHGRPRVSGAGITASAEDALLEAPRVFVPIDDSHGRPSRHEGVEDPRGDRRPRLFTIGEVEHDGARWRVRRRPLGERGEDAIVHLLVEGPQTEVRDAIAERRREIATHRHGIGVRRPDHRVAA